MIDRAATAVGGTRPDFMIDAACRAAEPALIGQTFALVDAGSYQHYLEVLDQPSGGKGSRALMSAHHGMFDYRSGNFATAWPAKPERTSSPRKRQNGTMSCRTLACSSAAI